MRYSPTTVSQDNLELLRSPYLGGMWQVYFANTPAVHLATITFTGADAAGISDDIATALAGLPDGTDVQVMAATPILSDAQLVITMACKDNTSPTPAVMAGTSTFAPPVWVADQSFNFQTGYAVDLIPATNGKTFTELTSISAVGGGRAGVVLELFQLPVITDWVAVGCTADVTFNDKSPTARGIDCGLKSDAFVVRGKSNPGSLTIRSKLRSMADGLPRYSGRKITCMLVGSHDDQVVGDRLVFTQYTPTVTSELPEGDGEAVVNVDGKFVDLLMFVAPYDNGVSAGGAGGGLMDPETGGSILDPESGGQFFIPEG
jgi:hypothetical protein